MMRGSRKKIQKPPFLVILGQKGPFWTVFHQNGQNGENYKKTLGKFFSHVQALLTVKFQKQVMSGFRENALRTDGCTDRHDS